MTDGEILLSINKTLQGVQTKVVKAGPKVVEIRVMDKDRAGLQDKITKSLTQNRVKYTNEIEKSKSSFPVTKIVMKDSTIKLIYKKAGGGGSGAGAALTKTAESAQALYGALVFNVLKRPMTIKDVTKSNFEKALSTAITDEKFDTMVNGLPDDWIDSSIKGANEMYAKLRSGNYEFHRGSRKVDIIENAFKKVNKDEKAFGNLNKWSPADIYLIKKGFDPSPLSKEKTLKGLNEKMWEYMQDKKVIGMSLKKITGTAKISNKNFPTDKKISKAVYNGGTTNLDAMDGYVIWGSSQERIQFRSFGGDTSLTGWQGEIKGASANQGKISLGPLNFILKRHGLQQIPESSASASLATKNSEAHAKDIAEMMAYFGTIGKSEVDDTSYLIQQKTDKYRYSKYLVMKILTTLKKANKPTADEVVKDIYLYASSQASYSAPYMKLE